MRILGICWTQGRGLVLLFVLMVAPSAAEVRRLICNVSALPGGQFQYLLSPELGPECEEQGWEDRDKTALTRGSGFHLDLVHSVTDQSLVLRQCYNYTRFTGQCPGFTEAVCYFNCSSVTKVPDIVIPSNKICFGECFEKTHFIVSLVGIVVTLLLAIAAGWGFYKYRKRRGGRDLQQRAKELDESRKNLELVSMREGKEPDTPKDLELVPLQDEKEPDDPDCVPLSDVHVD